MSELGPLICIRPERDPHGSEAIVEIFDGRIMLTIARRANGRDVFATIPARQRRSPDRIGIESPGRGVRPHVRGGDFDALRGRREGRDKLSDLAERYGDWIQVRSGGKFYPLDPRPEEITIEDIAHALSQVVRYTGHTSQALSVAQHSVMVSWRCDPADALWGLLHDASEAYLNDISRPVKQMPEMAPYRDAEDRLMAVICGRFGLPAGMPASVKEADEILLATESRDLMAPRHPDWERWISRVETLPGRIIPWPAGKSRRMFLGRYEELAGVPAR